MCFAAFSVRGQTEAKVPRETRPKRNHLVLRGDVFQEGRDLVLSALLKYVPVSLRARMEHRPNVQMAFGNAVWLVGDRVLRLGVGLLIGVWIARYLGPEQFGLLNFATAIVALLSGVAALGLNGIVVRDLVEKPETAHTTLGTAFVLQGISGLLAFFLAITFIYFARPGDESARFMVAVLGFTLVFKSADVVRYWFESQVKSRYVVLVDNAVFLVLVLVRIGLIVGHAPLMAFAWTLLAEATLVAMGLVLLYRRKVGELTNWSASLVRAKSLLVESWPLILGAVASMINMRVSQILLGTMTNDSLVGNYSAAVRISEIWLVIPGILGSSIFPALISAKRRNEAVYRKRILQSSYYMAVVVLPVALIVSLWADPIAHLLYGSRYVTAGSYLAVLIWSGVPYLVFFVFGQMFYIERLLRMSLYVAIVVIVLNVSLNLLLIPEYGGLGAAVATLVTAVVANVFSLVLINASTKIFWGTVHEKK